MITALSGDPTDMNTSNYNSDSDENDVQFMDSQGGVERASAKKRNEEERRIQEEFAHFQRSTKMHRSPPSAKKEELRQHSASESESLPPTEHRTAPTKSPTRTSTTERENFISLGEYIRSLSGMLVGGRRSIHQPMRDAIDSIKILYELMAIQRQDEIAKVVIRQENCSQTTPGLERQTFAVGKRRFTPNIETPDPKRKHKQTSAPKPKMKNVEDVHTPVNKVGLSNAASRKKGDEGEEGWTKVSKKKVTKRSQEPRKPKIRPDAILIGAKEGMSYADILRTVKSDPNLAAIGSVVSRIRRTQKGELLLQLNEAGAKTTEAKESISAALGTHAEVKALTHKTTIECKDIDEVTTKEEIRDAIMEQFGVEEATLTEAISLRETFGHTQTATISLPVESAKKLLDVGRIKIGWVVCRIRERTKITKCFKCLEFGHLAKQCKSGVDRSKLCRRCGNGGHIAKDCKEEPSCMFCRSDQTQDAKHNAGSNKCPVFRRAINSRRLFRS